MKNKYQIGSQWRTRGGWRSMVLDVLDEGRILKVWHERINTFTLHDKKGFDVRKFNSDYDLMEPWVEKRSGAVYLHVNKNGNIFVRKFKDTICSADDPVIAIKRIEWTEGHFDD